MKNSINVTFSVDKCVHAKNNGEHTINLDMSALTEEDFEQYALRSIVINLQAMLRGKGKTAEEFDGSKPYKVSAPGNRIATGNKVGKVTKLLDALTEEQRKELIKKYMAELEAGE